MTDWTAHLDLRLPRGLSDDEVDLFLDNLAGHSPALSVGEQRVGVTLTVEDQPDAAAALSAGLTAARGALAEAVGIPEALLAGAEVITVDEHDRRLAEPNYPDLVSSAEAAEVLGVSRQRLHQLHREHPQFPDPLYQLRTGPLWTADSILGFATRWDRRPGRPRTKEVTVAEGETGGLVIDLTQGESHAGVLSTTLGSGHDEAAPAP